MFLSRNKKNNVYPCKPQFYYIKVGFKGSILYRYVFLMNFDNLGKGKLNEATYQISKGSSTSSVKHHTGTHIIKNTVTKQSKGLNDDLKPEYKQGHDELDHRH